jgi:1-acyl-sn-glycerol-3-phosphate acyltransferase
MANVILWCSLLFCFALIKAIIPIAAVRTLIDPILIKIAEAWVSGNTLWMKLTQRSQWDIEGLNDLHYKGWYLVNANHQSWVDIFILQRALNRRIPLLKFFLKQELIKVPIMGMAWWALDFPFMRRYSTKFLEKNPHMRGKDLETTQKSCEKFSTMPTSVMNFLEGTRFNEKKHSEQQSPYRHLLKPKAGGIAFVLNAMGQHFDAILNVTIYYPNGIPSFWDFLCGRMTKVVIRMDKIQIPQHFINNNYQENPEFRQEFQQWVAQMWEDKDQQLDNLQNTSLQQSAS